VYILDTTILIYFFKGIGQVSQNLLNTPPNEIAIPTIVLYELEYGIAKSSSPEKRTRQLSEICSVVKILPFTDNDARQSALIRAELESKGKPIGPYDLLIAGIAVANNGVLITNNTAEFKHVSTLRIGNWY